jgi:hypothetical protein
MPLSIGLIKNISTADTAAQIIAQASQEGKRAVAVKSDGGWSIRITKPQTQIAKFLGAITGQNQREQSRLADLIASLPTLASLRDRSAQVVAQKYVSEFKPTESSNISGEALSDAIAKAWPADPKPQAPQVNTTPTSPKPTESQNTGAYTFDIDLHTASNPVFNQWLEKNIHSAPLDQLWATVPGLEKKGNYVRGSLIRRAVVREYAHQQLGVNQKINKLSDFGRRQWADTIANRLLSTNRDGTPLPFNTIKQRIFEKVTLLDNGFTLNDI